MNRKRWKYYKRKWFGKETRPGAQEQTELLSSPDLFTFQLCDCRHLLSLSHEAEIFKWKFEKSMIQLKKICHFRLYLYNNPHQSYPYVSHDMQPCKPFLFLGIIGYASDMKKFQWLVTKRLFHSNAL